MEAARPFLLGGHWQRSALTAKVVNPFTGETIAEICRAGQTEAAAAVQAAEAATVPMRELPAHVRADALLRIAAALRARQEEVARTITAEAGKPITDSRREVARAIQTFSVAAEEAKRIPGEIVPMDWTPGTEFYLGILRRFPIGPILGITPFNFPLNLVAHKVAPALAAGNPIVIKPAPQTPLTALLLGEIVLESGLPAGALSIVPCDNAVAERLVVDDRFKMLSFTGSAAVGWMLKGKAGKKRVTLELGGNAAVIVEPDADLDVAAQRCAAGGYAYAGQTCISVQRIFVHQSVLQPFTEKLLAQVAALKAGDPIKEDTVIGPLIDQAAARRVEAWIGEAVAQGGRLLLGGKRSGSVVEATVLSEVTPTMKVSCQEVFGPVVTVSPYQRFEDALTAVNDSPYGLQAGVFTRDVGRIFHAFRNLEVGTVLANEIPTFRADHMPYGGVKDSGLGREGVRYAIEEMTEPRLLVLNLRQ
ncbi:MAG TPA: aldehyde dehydrogenase family protein [Nitrospiraceae bacterium]|nr:aldehyde dehydrogenase family protein [Nitrospiraceae bacterium]